MKKIIFILTLLYCQKAISQNFTADKLGISQLLIMQQVAWNKGSIEGFMAPYWNNDSLQFIGKKGIIFGWQNTLDNYKKSYPDSTAMGQLSFEIIKINILSKNDAFVIGKWFLNRNGGKENLGGYFTLLLKKMKDKWIIVSDHSS
jgi:hypothetical protein